MPYRLLPCNPPAQKQYINSARKHSRLLVFQPRQHGAAPLLQLVFLNPISTLFFKLFTLTGYILSHNRIKQFSTLNSVYASPFGHACSIDDVQLWAKSSPQLTFYARIRLCASPAFGLYPAFGSLCTVCRLLCRAFWHSRWSYITSISDFRLYSSRQTT